MTRSLRAALAAAVMALPLGCSPAEEPGPPPPDEGPRPAPDCQAEVTVPYGLNGTPGLPAEPHAEVLGANPEPFQVHLGAPSRDPSASVSFLWRTDVDTLATVVEYAEGTDLSGDRTRVEGATFLFDGDAERMHEVRLCGTLTPATAYTYRVGFDGAWSPEHTFSTPGEPGSFDTLRVAIAGDSRGAYTTWASMVQQMEAFEPDLYLFAGDMVELGPYQGEWDAWFEAAGDVLARKLLIPTHGNHEFLAQNYFAQFGMPRNEEWFSIDYGPLHLVSLNDSVRDVGDLNALQPQYLQEVLPTSSAPWTIAMHHRSGYSSCTVHGSALDVREAWYPILEDNDVDLVVAGHNHIYERSVPIRDGAEVAPGAGTTYLVTGGAGAPLYTSTEETFFTEVADSIEHFIILDLGPQGATATVYDREENVIDTFELPAR